MTQSGQPPVDLNALVTFRNACFERARFARDMVNWFVDARESILQWSAERSADYERLAQEEEQMLRRIDETLAAMGAQGLPPPTAQPTAPAAIVIPPGHTLSPTGDIVPVTTAPGEAARAMPGRGYHSGPQPDEAGVMGRKGGIGDAVPVPQTVVDSVQYEKGEVRPPEAKSGHMPTLPRSAAELRVERDKLREESQQAPALEPAPSES